MDMVLDSSKYLINCIFVILVIKVKMALVSITRNRNIFDELVERKPILNEPLFGLIRLR